MVEGGDSALGTHVRENGKYYTNGTVNGFKAYTNGKIKDKSGSPVRNLIHFDQCFVLITVT